MNTDSQENSQASASQSRISQEESLLPDNSDLHQEGDPQSTGSEIWGSFHLVSMSSTEQIEVLTESLGDPEERKDRENEPCEEGTVSLTDLNKRGDMSSQENNQVPSRACDSKGQTSQGESLLDENSDLHQQGDTQSAGSEIGESSRLTRMSSTWQTEELRLFLFDSMELNERVHQAWVEERESCVQRVKLLSQEIKELQLEFERTSARIVPAPCLCSLLWKKNRIAAEENRKLKDKCQKLKALSLETLRLKLINRKHLQDLDKCEHKRKKLQAWRSVIVNIFEQMKEKEAVCKRLAELEEEEVALISECERERLARAPEPSFWRRLFFSET